MSVVSIDRKIVGVELVQQSTEDTELDPVFLTSLHEGIRRPDILESKTYKIRTPLSDSAIYVTISDIVLNAGTTAEIKRPFEIFINCREMENFQWIVALTRLMSSVFRKGGDLTYIVRELKSIFDPGGGYLTKNGRIPSLVAEIGIVVEKHFLDLGLISNGQRPDLEQKKEEFVSRGGDLEQALICKKCHSKSVIRLDGCMTCVACGDSKCQ